MMSSRLTKIVSAFEKQPVDVVDPYIPPLGQDYVTVCLTSSNEYSPIVCVSIKSLAENSNPNRKYDVIILTKDMSVRNKEQIIAAISANPNVSIRFVNVSNWIKNYNFHLWAHFTEFTYYRLLIPTLFKLYKKVLYLDSDTIVNVDLYNLYKLDLNEYLLAAAVDTHVMGRINDSTRADPDYYQNVLGIGGGGYFQGGVMLFNVTKFNEMYGDGELIQKANETSYRWLDQDFLNVECKGRVKYLPNKWNLMVINNPNCIDEQHLQEPLFSDYISARKNPYIIHYIGRSIPCYNPFVDYYEYFWRYAKLTPYYELLINKMVLEREKHESARVMNILKNSEYAALFDFVSVLFPEKSRRLTILQKLSKNFKGKNRKRQ
ncbi:glycosyl transferase GT8 family [methanogenic archaeon ISO4-H5]|nr:glycosyl transferase GT8 family [methanogenic archaeon ISO4-H5]